MSFIPKTQFFRNPIPRRRRPPSNAVGKVARVLGSTAVPVEVGASERERAAHMGEESRWGDGSTWFADLRETARPMPAETAAAAAAMAGW